jgi:hypothetical protein
MDRPMTVSACDCQDRIVSSPLILGTAVAIEEA